ncbi:MAG TPA: hypothetical protein VEU52_08565 [Candidatus Limnocylindrales bacterium]|nr:hypothetical protein [Candidatus Limnocylindrales bacterium]
MYRVYEAKKLSEIAEGVGTQTSLMIIEHDHTQTHFLRARVLDDEGINSLQAVYESQGFNRNVPKWDSKDAFRILGGDAPKADDT